MPITIISADRVKVSWSGSASLTSSLMAAADRAPVTMSQQNASLAKRAANGADLAIKPAVVLTALREVDQCFRASTLACQPVPLCLTGGEGSSRSRRRTTGLRASREYVEALLISLSILVCSLCFRWARGPSPQVGWPSPDCLSLVRSGPLRGGGRSRACEHPIASCASSRALKLRNYY